MAQWVSSLDLTAHTSLSSIWRGFAPSFVNYKIGCTRLAATSDKVYQLLAHGWWFSPASSTTKSGHDDIAEILLKVALHTKHSNSKHFAVILCHDPVIIHLQTKWCDILSSSSWNFLNFKDNDSWHFVSLPISKQDAERWKKKCFCYLYRGSYFFIWFWWVFF